MNFVIISISKQNPSTNNRILICSIWNFCCSLCFLKFLLSIYVWPARYLIVVFSEQHVLAFNLVWVVGPCKTNSLCVSNFPNVLSLEQIVSCGARSMAHCYEITKSKKTCLNRLDLFFWLSHSYHCILFCNVFHQVVNYHVSQKTTYFVERMLHIKDL